MYNKALQSVIVEVAVPLPLRQTFDYLVPAGVGNLCIGCRVKVPFGSRNLIGLIVKVKKDSDYSVTKLKKAIEVIDSESIFDDALWATIEWISRYYLAPIGEVIDAALPVHLRQGKQLQPTTKRVWQLTEFDLNRASDELRRAPLQLAIIKRLIQSRVLDAADLKQESPSWRQAIGALETKGWVTSHMTEPRLLTGKFDDFLPVPILNSEQQIAAKDIQSAVHAERFSCLLLQGVTGSGKTEVYFHAMQSVVANGQQILFLVPEIGLTPQLISRIKQRFNVPVVDMHSGLNNTERHLAWWHAKTDNAQIIVGTRSAIFSSISNLGLIVIDEEHDGSLKQQDGVRYQARDVAIYRAKQHKIPIVLGSATPSFESYVNAKSGRYTWLKLTERATKVALPVVSLLDIRNLPMHDGLSLPLLSGIEATLQNGKQCIIFLNRRGYAPILYCSNCGETTKCHRCDSHLTIHRRVNRMRCHHCGYEGKVLSKCSVCQSKDLVEVGEGTQRIEDILNDRFPDARILRIDRDSTRRKGELAKLLEQARSGQADILLGTQLITKGHDFPNVAMVGVLNADQGLYSIDFRATEILFQQLLQVAGRAGRREQVGQVLIQTAFPEHPLFERLRNHDFDGFADELLQQRSGAGYPPFGYFALLRAESMNQNQALQFLRQTKNQLCPLDGVRVMDAIPAPMERKAGKYRAQLLLCAQRRSNLNKTLTVWLEAIKHPQTKKRINTAVRWSVDIDPLDCY